MKRERDPTPEEFEEFLAWLDPDPELAGARYESLRKGLIRIFVTRGCIDPERLSDEVFNRVKVRIKKLRLDYDDPAKCLHGFAENVYREYLRDSHHREESLDDSHYAQDMPDNEDAERLEREDQCLAECLNELAHSERDLFCTYFSEEPKIKARKRLAEQLQLTTNALRIKAHRARRKMRECLERCLASSLGGETI